MILSTMLFLKVTGYKPVTCEYREIRTAPKVALSLISNPKSRQTPHQGDWRLFLNGKGTSFFESATGMDPTIQILQRKDLRDVYIRSTRSSNGAIMAWTQTLLFWDRTSLARVECPSLDVLEFHPDGRVLGIVQSDSFTVVGKNEIGWEQDRRAYVVMHGKAIDLGWAVNLWFGKDGWVHGISNGAGSKAAPHYFTVANGVRKDGPVDQSHPLKRTGKRLFGLPGVDQNY